MNRADDICHALRQEERGRDARETGAHACCMARPEFGSVSNRTPHACPAPVYSGHINHVRRCSSARTIRGAHRPHTTMSARLCKRTNSDLRWRQKMNSSARKPAAISVRFYVWPARVPSCFVGYGCVRSFVYTCDRLLIAASITRARGREKGRSVFATRRSAWW